MLELPNKKYQIIYADPPWKWKNYNDKTAHWWVGKHYSLMDLEEIKSLPIKDIVDNDCVLFIWISDPFLSKVFAVIKSWGFEYKTVAFTWVKTNKSDGKDFLGMGYWTRSNPEMCLLGTKGHPKRLSANVKQLVFSKRGEHSRKPDEVRNKIVELIGDVPRIELFARQRFEGWDAWGNEVSKTTQKLLTKNSSPSKKDVIKWI